MRTVIKLKNGTKKGYLYANNGDGIDLAYVTSKARRGRVQVKSLSNNHAW